MATLYTHAESNIRKTWFYISFFLIFVILLGWLISYISENYIILWIAVIYSVVSSFFSYWYSDKIVLGLVNAKEIKKLDNPELYRIVENLSITAGLPVPKIYIIQEDQPNAFATGRDPKHGVVAVTTGLLKMLDRSELEGVIAHELAHIGNRDALLQTVVVVLVGVVVMITDLFIRISFYGGFSRKSNDNKGNIGAILLIISIVLVILAPIVASIIKFAISRKREFLADASGALLTRYPEGLAKALEKISGYPNSMRKLNNSTAHLFISNPFRGKRRFSKIFMTHPSLEERLKALRDMKV